MRRRAREIIDRQTYKLMIGRSPGNTDGVEELDVSDPASGEVVAHVPLAGPNEVDSAVAAARRSFESGSWSRIVPAARARILWRTAELIEANAEELALTEALDAGKPLLSARQIDIPQAAAHFRYQAAAAMRLDGHTIPISDSRVFNYTVFEPMGVVAAITPWNFPLVIAARSIAPALAAGNSVILKPAEETPLTSFRLAELMQEAGIPEGVLAVLSGTGESAGLPLACHNDVDKIVFTGSQDAARQIIRASAANFKRLSLELGGKSPAIVCEDADLSKSLPALIIGAFSNQGQNCCAATRILVHRERRDELAETFIAATEQLKVGDNFESDTRVGPLITADHRARVEHYISEAVADGARILTGGQEPEVPGQNGWFLTPAVIDEVNPRSPLATEEVFGPCVTLEEFDNLDQAVAMANATTYGLAAGVFTDRSDTAQELSRRLRSGTIWVNCYERFDAAAPFGGVKQSGYGHSIGHVAIKEFMDVKSVWLA
jgi:acyl-CoA reductase-like NAD-dependent aldehyde dehydrogenase